MTVARAGAALEEDQVGEMGAGHFIYIPAILFAGIVIGWIMGSRAAKDAYAIELKRREEAAARKAGR
jgi:hypothetical protein